MSELRLIHGFHAVTSSLRQRAGLSPTGHAPVHEARVLRETNFRSQSESLHHAGAESFEQCICLGNQFKHQRNSFGVL